MSPDPASVNVPMVMLSNMFDDDIGNQMVFQWSDLVEMFSQAHVRRNKDGRCYMPVSVKPQDEWVSQPKKNKPRENSFRLDANIKSVSAAVIDLDAPGALEKAEKTFARNEYIVHSTHSYTAETPYKMRMILCLSEPVPADKWEECCFALVAKVNADQVCRNQSRIFFWPSISPDAGMEPFYRHNKGRPLTPEDLAHRVVLYRQEHPKRTFTPKHRDPQWAIHLSNLNYYRPHYTWAALCDRQQRAIAGLQTSDSRHGFALSAISRELHSRGAATHFPLFVAWMYRAAEAFSSRGLDSGNTPEELPGIFESAVIKFAPEIIEDRFGGDASAFAAHIDDSISWGHQAQQMDSWPIESASDRSDLAFYDRKHFSEQAYRLRHAKSIRTLWESRNPVAFVEDVWRQEGNFAEDRQEQMTVVPLIQFLYASYRKYCARLKISDERIDNIGVYLKEHAPRLSLRTRLPLNDFDRYLEAAVALAAHPEHDTLLLPTHIAEIQLPGLGQHAQPDVSLATGP